jgi:peptidoglycan/xylan/chitin deacetylase (PgdA/CDA1 family)
LLHVLDHAQLRPDIHVTFDDGNRSDIDIVVPELLRRGLTAGFFVCAARLNAPGFLSSEDLRAMVTSGMTIGSHGMQHRSWRGLPKTELHEEIVLSRIRLENVLGTPISSVAVPFGQYDRRVLAALRANRFSRAFTSDGGPAWEETWLQARNTIRRTHGRATIDRILSGHEPIGTRLLRRFKCAVKRWR